MLANAPFLFLRPPYNFALTFRDLCLDSKHLAGVLQHGKPLPAVLFLAEPGIVRETGTQTDQNRSGEADGSLKNLNEVHAALRLADQIHDAAIDAPADDFAFELVNVVESAQAKGGVGPFGHD